MDRYVVVRDRALLDLLDLASRAAESLRDLELASPLADALNGARAEVEADLYVSA